MSNFVKKPLLKGSHSGDKKDDEFGKVSAKELYVSSKIAMDRGAKISFIATSGEAKTLEMSKVATKTHVKTEIASESVAIRSEFISNIATSLPAAFSTAVGTAAIGIAVSTGTGASAVRNVVAPLIAPFNFTMITTNNYQLVKGNYILSVDEDGNEEVTEPTLPAPIAGTVITIYGPYAYTLVLNDSKTSSIAAGIIVCFAISNTKWKVFNMPGTNATFA